MTTRTIFIDNLAFAKKNDHLIDELLLVDCPRLNDFLHHFSLMSTSNILPSGSIHYELLGETDAAGRPFLHLTLAANLITICQRCLNEMPLKFALNFKYLIGEVGDFDLMAPEGDGSDDYDMQQVSFNMDIVALVEDEIIMAMPIAPTHEQLCGEIVNQSGGKPNPFAILKGLIKP